MPGLASRGMRQRYGVTCSTCMEASGPSRSGNGAMACSDENSIRAPVRGVPGLERIPFSSPVPGEVKVCRAARDLPCEDSRRRHERRRLWLPRPRSSHAMPPLGMPPRAAGRSRSRWAATAGIWLTPALVLADHGVPASAQGGGLGWVSWLLIGGAVSAVCLAAWALSRSGASRVPWRGCLAEQTGGGAPVLMEIVVVAVRWLHVAAAVSLVGVFACFVLVLRPATREASEVGRAQLRDLDARLLKLAGWALAVTVIAGTLDLWRQVGVATGASVWESLDGGRVLSVLADTRYGTVWLARMGLLVLLAALLLLAEEGGPGDWLALRLEAFGLSAASLVLGAAAGHAAAVEGGALAMGLDGLHLLASGVWAGGLVPLALCLAWARSLSSDAVAGRAAEGFSRVGLGAVTILAATGAFATWQHVGGVPALLGDGLRALAPPEARPLRSAPAGGCPEPARLAPTTRGGRPGQSRRPLRRSGATCWWRRA